MTVPSLSEVCGTAMRRAKGIPSEIGKKIASWYTHEGLVPAGIAVLAIIMLPNLGFMNWFYSSIGSVTSNFPESAELFGVVLRRGAHSDAIYQWQVWGIAVNAMSLVLPTIRMFLPNSVTRIDRFFGVVYLLAFIVSLTLILFIKYTPSTLYILVVFYGIYVFTDVVGIVATKTDYGRAKYAYPLFCLDLPSFSTASILVWYATVTPIEFLEGMAAGHLILGSFAYLWIMGGVVPHRLGKLAPNGVAYV